MRIHEFVVETEIVNEVAPVNMMGQLWRKVSGQGVEANVGKLANELYQKFQTQARSTGITLKNTPVSELQKWFKKEGLTFPPSYTGNNYRNEYIDLTNKAISNNFWTDAAFELNKIRPAAGPTFAKQYGLSPSTAAPPRKTPSSRKTTPPASNPKLDAEITAMQALIKGMRNPQTRNALQTRLNALVKAAKTTPTA